MTAIGASQKPLRALSMSEYERLADMARTAIHFALWSIAYIKSAVGSGLMCVNKV